MSTADSRQASAILLGRRLSTKCRRRACSTVCTWSRLTALSVLISSSTPTSTSLGAPWIVEVTGATTTVRRERDDLLTAEH